VPGATRPHGHRSREDKESRRGVGGSGCTPFRFVQHEHGHTNGVLFRQIPTPLMSEVRAACSCSLELGSSAVRGKRDVDQRCGGSVPVPNPPPLTPPPTVAPTPAPLPLRRRLHRPRLRNPLSAFAKVVRRPGTSRAGRSGKPERAPCSCSPWAWTPADGP
jgi:hypothetical protein